MRSLRAFVVGLSIVSVGLVGCAERPGKKKEDKKEDKAKAESKKKDDAKKD